MLDYKKHKDFSVELYVKNGGDAGLTFEKLKELQELEYAYSDSTIVLNGVRVPAGYCEDFHHFITTYGAIIVGDHALIYDQILDEFSDSDAVKFLAICSNSMKSQGRTPFTKVEVKDFLEYRSFKKQNKLNK